MKIGIIGLPQTGKKTLFQLLTGGLAPAHADAARALVGTADIRDARFDALVEMYTPPKQVRAKIDFALVPRIDKEGIIKGDLLKDIADTEAICHVVRAFTEEAVYHVDGSVNPQRDIDSVNAELMLHDLLFIETRIERIDNSLKKSKDERLHKEKSLLARMKAHLESERPLRLLPLSHEEDLLIRSYPFITRKQMILVLNVSDGALGSQDLLRSLQDCCASEHMEAMQVSARVEAEIDALESEKERQEFLQELGIAEPALEQLTRLCLKALGLISFFTVAHEEVHQWLAHKGALAPEAAGVVHSDLQRGFIRAEVIKYAELMQYQSEAALKHAGKIYVKGKDYIVEDGDILRIRFNI
jgi:hypothetical protein